MIIDSAYAMGPNPQGGQGAGGGLMGILPLIIVGVIIYLVVRARR